MKEILFLEPVVVDLIWGREIWTISAHEHGDCTISTGEYQGKKLSELWKTHRELFGNMEGDRFPLLVKKIEARDDLSIQVHPDDAYAKVHEHGSLGKTECWYVLDCDADGTIIVGHHAKNREEVAETVSWFEENGLKVKTERGDRVFPESDHSSDVIRTLERKLKSGSNSVKIRLKTEVKEVMLGENSQVTGVILKDGERLSADAVIIATGGCSYPACGSTGDGYRFGEQTGHHLTDRQPALVPLVAAEDWIRELQGLSLKNVTATLVCGRKKVYEDFGEMLFTHFGVSGPLILSASSYIKPDMYQEGLKLMIDLKPALSEQQLDERVLRDFAENQNKQFKNSLSKLLPAKLIPVIIRLSGIKEDRHVNEITREERSQLVHVLKQMEVTITGSRGFEEAIITHGGIS